MTASAPVIHLMENHDEAYRVWRRAGVRARVLVHVDAHHDMWWLDGPREISIANYICPAIKEGLVRAAYWVVPDRSFATLANRAAVGQHVQKIVDRYPGPPAAINSDGRVLRTTVLGCPLVVGTLDALPPIAEPVLLDLDTDYLVIPKVTYGKRDRPAALPWTWPGDLVSRLRKQIVTADIVTIAYSVDGGYTPIGWKYLGDELAWRLGTGSREADDDPNSAAFDAMKTGALAQSRRAHAAAEAAFMRAGDEIGAAPGFRLAHLLASQGRVEDGRRWYERAVTRDPSYRAPFATPGIPLYITRAYDQAEQAFRQSADLDPANASARVGLAWVAARRRRWPDAEAHARAALEVDPGSIDAHRVLGEALDRQGAIAEAIAAYEQSLKLALRGGRPFNAVTATDPGGDRMVDADHARTHAQLARLHERAGDVVRAVAGYRIAAAGGYETAPMRRRLSRLVAGQKARRPSEAGAGRLAR